LHPNCCCLILSAPSCPSKWEHLWAGSCVRIARGVGDIPVVPASKPISIPNFQQINVQSPAREKRCLWGRAFWSAPLDPAVVELKCRVNELVGKIPKTKKISKNYVRKRCLNSWSSFVQAVISLIKFVWIINLPLYLTRKWSNSPSSSSIIDSKLATSASLSWKQLILIKI
jgi:hypothetical protein